MTTILMFFVGIVVGTMIGWILAWSLLVIVRYPLEWLQRRKRLKDFEREEREKDFLDLDPQFLSELIQAFRTRK